MNADSLIERLKRARIVQVGAVYLGASWVVLQLVDVLADALRLPEWVAPVAVILLGIGFVVVAATAWVQSLPSTTAAEEAGERPTDWEIAPADAVASLKAGRLPHLTWARALLGGVVALSLLIGGAGGYVLLTGGEGLVGARRLVGPSPAGADEAAAGIAVVPFTVSGSDYELYREGMVDLLSTNLDGIGGYRAIDNRTVLARWREEVGDDPTPDLRTSLAAAGRTGARFALVGGLTAVGSQVRLAVDLHDLADGREIGSARAEGSPDELLALVDELSVGVARELLGADSAAVVTRQGLSSLTTHSLTALEHYLEGDRLLRRAQPGPAAEQFRAAVAADSTFALAWFRLTEARGWLAQEYGPELRAAARHADRLSARMAELVRTTVLFHDDDPAGLPTIEAFIRRYPDEAEGYHLGSEFLVHKAHLGSRSRETLMEWLEASVSLDPEYAPSQNHYIEMLLAFGDSVEAERWIRSYAELVDGPGGYKPGFLSAYGILFRPDGARPDWYEAAVPTHAFSGNRHRTDYPARLLPYLRALARDRARPDDALGATLAAYRAGRPGEAREWAAGRDPGGEIALVVAEWERLYGLDDAEVVHAAFERAGCPSPYHCFRLAEARAVHAAHAGHAEERARALRDLERHSEAFAAEGAPDELAFFSPPGFGPRRTPVAVGDARARATGLLAAGDARAALDDLRAQLGRTAVDPLLLAEAAEAAGDDGLAERTLVGYTWQIQGPVATLRLARLYERTGRADEALEAYRRLAVTWEEAEPDFAPAAEVREALTRLAS